MINFHLFKSCGHGSETQLQVGENLNEWEMVNAIYNIIYEHNIIIFLKEALWPAF